MTDDNSFRNTALDAAAARSLISCNHSLQINVCGNRDVINKSTSRYLDIEHTVVPPCAAGSRSYQVISLTRTRAATAKTLQELKKLAGKPAN